jgi:hypothetical protein
VYRRRAAQSGGRKQIEALYADHDPFTPSYVQSGTHARITQYAKGKRLNYDELLFESDIGHEYDMGSRLVDLPENREDFELWTQLLQFQRDNNGKDGILDIWRGMMIRCRDLELPVTGPHADELWGIFIEFGVEDKDFLETVFRYAQWLWIEKGKRWPKLYSTIIRNLLEHQPKRKHVWNWHLMLRGDHLRSPNDIRLAFPWKSSDPGSERQFKYIYYDTPSPKIYSDIIPRLCKEGRFEEALRWHNVFLIKKDLPTVNQVMPLLQYLQSIGDKKNVDEMTRNLIAVGVTIDSEALSKLASNQALTPDTIRVVLGKDPELIPEDKTDEFCARLFATGSFSFGFVVVGLQMFGIKSIGPISVREIAISAGSPEAIEDRFRQMKDANIDVGQSPFVRLVQKLARVNDQDMLQALLESDQHPDVVANWKLQERFLRQYQVRQDWRNFKKTMAILTLDSDSDEVVWNLHLRTALRNANRSAVTKCVEFMQEKHITVTQKTVSWMYFTILAIRHKGKPEIRKDPTFDGLGYLTSLWQGMLQSNIAQIRAYHWRDVIKRLGMAGRWYDLQALLLWLASYYAPIEPTDNSALSNIKLGEIVAIHQPILASPIPFDKRREFKELLHTPLQCAIIEWGFIHPYRTPRTRANLSTNHPSAPTGLSSFRAPNNLTTWTRGLVLLQTLSAHGITLSTPSVRRICRHRLRYFFGSLNPILMTKPQKARRLRRLNKSTLQNFLIDAETVWPGLFSEFKAETGEWARKLVNPPQLGRTKYCWERKRVLMREGLWRANRRRKKALRRLERGR